MSETPSVLEEHRSILMKIARNGLLFAVRNGLPLKVNLADYPEILRRERATFVTLKKDEQLRGCIGTIVARRPLVADIAYNSYAASCEDLRFPPVKLQELNDLSIDISILSPLEKISCASEGELLETIRPGIDGIYMEDSDHSSTFLPVVWEQLPQPKDFLAQLKAKGEFPVDYWTKNLQVYRYTSECFGGPYVG